MSETERTSHSYRDDLARVLAKSRRGVTARVNDADRAQADAALRWMHEHNDLAFAPESE